MEGNASPFVEAEAGPCASTMNWSTLKQSILSDNGFSIGRERERERERERNAWGLSSADWCHVPINFKRSARIVQTSFPVLLFPKKKKKKKTPTFPSPCCSLSLSLSLLLWLPAVCSFRVDGPPFILSLATSRHREVNARGFFESRKQKLAAKPRLSISIFPSFSSTGAKTASENQEPALPDAQLCSCNSRERRELLVDSFSLDAGFWHPTFLCLNFVTLIPHAADERRSLHAWISTAEEERNWTFREISKFRS